jgi:hypothetical protein
MVEALLADAATTDADIEARLQRGGIAFAGGQKGC